MTARSVRLLAASPPILFALLILKLWVTGTLRYYVNDRTVWIVLFGGVCCALVGLASMRQALVSRDGPHIGWRTGVFLAPVLIGLILPAHPLSATSGQASSLGALQLASHVSTGTSGDAFGYWVNSLADHPDPTWWTGQHVTLVGFVAHQVGMPKRSVIVGRYLVTCCVVDATLMGFPVQVDKGQLPVDGSWVQVSGVFGSHTWTDPSGQDYPLIQHARLAPVSIPSSPYLNP